MTGALLVVTGVLVVLGIIFAEPVTRAIASADIVGDVLRALGFATRAASPGGFASVEGKLELTTQLTRIMMPFLTTVAVAVALPCTVKRPFS